jgi:glyoxylase-like metal-dependent hydrolase (beta-lactamase superfamily II)
MSSVRFDVISIGALSRNRLWGEREPVRTSHATTTLIRTGKRHILVDPGLPPMAVGAHLYERTGLRPQQIDTVFLTNFRPSHRAGLALFPHAKVFLHEVEQQTVRQHLEHLLAGADTDDENREMLEEELELVNATHAPDDQLAEHIDLFPLFGYTPGTCGLLVTLPTLTLVITGDAVPTHEHFLAGQLLPDTHDLEAAGESLREVYEIADLIIPGHDNLFLNPRSQGM